MTGRVKSYRPRHYGFITSEDQDYKFTHKDWTLRLPPAEGLIVDFTPGQTEKGLVAKEIRRSTYGKKKQKC